MAGVEPGDPRLKRPVACRLPTLPMAPTTGIEPATTRSTVGALTIRTHGCVGAAAGTRTRRRRLKGALLDALHSAARWCARWDSNPHSSACKAAAFPAWPLARDGGACLTPSSVLSICASRPHGPPGILSTCMATSYSCSASASREGPGSPDVSSLGGRGRSAQRISRAPLLCARGSMTTPDESPSELDPGDLPRGSPKNRNLRMDRLRPSTQLSHGQGVSAGTLAACSCPCRAWVELSALYPYGEAENRTR